MKQRNPDIATFVGLLLLLLLLLPVYAPAEDAPRIVDDGERTDLVITYTRQETPQKDVAANVTVITRKDMEKIPAANAAEIIQYTPGVSVEFNGGPGSVANASIQGSDIRHVAVFQDGVPLNMLANPSTDLSRIPIEAIERIEIYKGAASSAWGSALGGVINIITKEPNPTKPFSGELQGSYGDFETARTRGTVGGTVDRVGYLLSYTHESSDGFIPSSGFDRDAAYGKLYVYTGSTSRVGFIYSHDEGNTQDPRAFGSSFWNDMFQRRDYQRASFDTLLTDNIGMTLEARHQALDASIDNVFTDHKKNFFDYYENTIGFSARTTYDNKSGNRCLLGFDGDWGYYDFSLYSDRFQSGNWAVYANDTLDIGRFSFTGGLRYDENYDFGWEVSPSAGAVYHLPVADALIRTQVARGFSAPPGSLVHDPTFGNKDLKAETGTNYQLGSEAHFFKFLKLEVDLFRADVKNLLHFNPELMHYENLDKITRQGFEAGLGANFDRGLSLFFGGSFVDVRDSETGDLIEDIPRILYTASTSYTYKGMTNSIIGHYIYNNSSLPETRDRVFIFDYLFKAKLPSLPIPYTSRTGTPSIFAAVHNLTNTPYLLRVGARQPGRWIEGGVSFEF